MVLALLVGLILQFVVGLHDAALFAILGGMIVAQLLPLGPRSCDLPRRD